MAEIAVKKIPVKRIKDEEDWKKNRDAMQHYLEEYHWFISHESEESRVADTSEKLDDYLEKLNKVEKGSDEYNELNASIHALRVKFEHLKQGTYETIIRSNIRAEMIMLDDYDARTHKIPFREVARGLLKGDPKVKDYVSKRAVLFLNNSYGIQEQPQSLHLEPNPVDTFMHEYQDSLVETIPTITGEELQEKGLTIYLENPGIIQSKVTRVIGQGEAELLKQYEVNESLSEIKTEDVSHQEETTIDMNQTRGITISMEDSQRSSTVKEDRKPKEKGEEISI